MRLRRDDASEKKFQQLVSSLHPHPGFQAKPVYGRPDAPRCPTGGHSLWLEGLSPNCKAFQWSVGRFRRPQWLKSTTSRCFSGKCRNLFVAQGSWKLGALVFVMQG